MQLIIYVTKRFKISRILKRISRIINRRRWSWIPSRKKRIIQVISFTERTRKDIYVIREKDPR